MRVMVKLTGGEALVRTLMPAGIDTVFGLVGGKLGPLLAALAARPKVRFIGARHEGGAALMAAGHAAATGRLGVVVGECGSGAVNLTPGLAVANADSLSIIAVTSNNQHAMSYPGRGLFADMDTQRLFGPVTKWNAVVHDGRRIPELVHTALREACSGRCGAVHLDVPQDILRGSFEYDERALDASPSSYRVVDGPAAPAAGITEAVTLLAAAKRPLILAGGGAVQSGAITEVRALVARLGAAVAATQSALGIISSRDPNYIGHATVTSGPAFQLACEEADVVLAVGCRLSPWLWGADGPLPGRSGRLIHISIDPASLGRHVPLAVALWADARSALAAILAALGDGQPAAESGAWLRKLRAERARYDDTLAALARDAGSPLHPAALAQELAAQLPERSIVVYDGGHTTFWTNDFTPVAEARTRLHEVGMTQLGFGLPFAVAARLADPTRPVINVTGDGAFGFTLQELDTARRYGLPVVTVIHNNAAWGVIRHSQSHDAGFSLGGDLEGTDYAAIARGFGCFGELVTDRRDLGPALGRALASNRPAVLDCHVRFVPHPRLADFGRMSSTGIVPARPAPAANPPRQ